ncbi:hypothetical protein E2C01_044822 [Portunus trituberculatus]|uniref:BESS domain-containing protein n=1 Tax=Portunus trituberculatus TaxID=210409 RepID=A0A5B7FZD3_PORTR|nr:hypothetical protein [Portunus trituberculatus]
MQPPLDTASSICNGEDIQCSTTIRAKRKTCGASDVDKVIAYFHNKKDDVTQKDDLDHFFISVCQSTRKLSCGIQNKVKKDILDIIVQAEEQDETQASVHTYAQQHYTTLPYTPSPTSYTPSPVVQYVPSPLPSPCEEVVNHE